MSVSLHRHWHEVARLWAIGEMSEADEHVFAYSTQQIMASLQPRALKPAGVSSLSTDAGQPWRCVVLPVSGESHLIGARMVADLFAPGPCCPLGDPA